MRESGSKNSGEKGTDFQKVGESGRAKEERERELAAIREARGRIGVNPHERDAQEYQKGEMVGRRWTKASMGDLEREGRGGAEPAGRATTLGAWQKVKRGSVAGERKTRKGKMQGRGSKAGRLKNS